MVNEYGLSSKTNRIPIYMHSQKAKVDIDKLSIKE